MREGEYLEMLVRILLAVVLISTSSIASAKMCLVKDEALEKLLSNPKILPEVCPEQAKDIDILSAINLIEKYWHRSTSNATRYSMLTERNKKIHAKIYGVTSPNNYRIPGIGLERVLEKHRYNYILVGGPDFVQISLQVRWTQEGYEGDMTYIFDLFRENSKWRISIIYI